MSETIYVVGVQPLPKVLLSPSVESPLLEPQFLSLPEHPGSGYQGSLLYLHTRMVTALVIPCLGLP